MLMRVLDEALKLVEPTKEEREKVDKIAELAFNLVKDASKEFKEIKEIVFGGSYAKDTWISNDVDIDIFAKVDVNTDNERFEYIGRNLGLLALKDYKPYLKYAQHPYVEAIIEGIKINVVPCYDVKQGEWKSAADRSIYHTQFINDNFDEEKRREVRLLKRFMKTINVYGAEISVNGFSGYVCEVLILKYNTFINTLNNAKDFKEKTVISIYNYDKSLLDLFDTPIIIIDPIDNKRNLGAAISSNSLARFILASRKFIDNPSIKFFKQLSINPNRDLRKQVLVIKFSYRDRSDDIVWGEAKRSLRAITKQLQLHDFKVIRSACHVDIDNTVILFAILLEELIISKYYIREGPKIFAKDNSNKFLAANKDAEMIWLDDDRLKALKIREYNNTEEFLKMLLKEKLEQSGIAKGLIDDIRKGFVIYRDNFEERLINEIVDHITGTDELYL
ncbi:MAG: CCA tRNA nucleotidyltransferase [Candidatus Nitrosothermus koennekii]|nr:MAG: CCA tRNA nucleotidyltransferase [Candidatus Nitrosothermus koennekii]